MSKFQIFLSLCLFVAYSIALILHSVITKDEAAIGISAFFVIAFLFVLLFKGFK